MFTAPEPLPIVTAVDQAGLPTLGPPDIQAAPDPETWLTRFATLPLLAQPGERWFYNTSASILGVLVARAAERSFGEVLRDRIFAPLGMASTAFWTANQLVSAYRPTPDGLVPADPDNAWSRPPAFEDGAAGLVSTASDLLAFSRMLLRDGAGLLAPESVRAMTTDQLTPAQKAAGGLGPGFFDGQSWGFCMAVRDSGAFGWAGGLGTTWLADPVLDLTVIVLTQRLFETAEPPAVHAELQAAAYAAVA
jgi:CubicO group peptidase (beta-lactamase class C family)